MDGYPSPAEYQALAQRYGVQLTDQSQLTPYVMTQSTPISPVETEEKVLCSLHRGKTSHRLQYGFQEPGFIWRISSTVTALVLSEDGRHQLPTIDDPRDYLYANLSIQGSSHTYQDGHIPLSELCRERFHLIPVVTRGAILTLELSILPPGFNGVEPPFVRRVGQVTVTLHTDRIN